MANQPKSKAPEPPGGADFVRHIVKDPAHVPDVMRLYGYLGKSSEKAHERLYLTPDLSFYVEVPTAAVLYRMPVPPDQDPYGASMLWVRQDAQLKQKATPVANALAHYFAGALQAAAGPPRVQANQATGPACHTPAFRRQPYPGLPGYFNTGLVVCPTPKCETPYFPPAAPFGPSAPVCGAPYQFQMQPVVAGFSQVPCHTGPFCQTGGKYGCVTPWGQC